MKRSSLRNKGTGRGRRSTAGLRVLGLGAAISAATSCNSFDSTRQAGPTATLGDDIYGVFCDRLGASSFAEDLSGASYSSICHFDAAGHYGSTVDTTQLPVPTTPAEIEARRLSVAKLERLAQRHSDVIIAINLALPDVQIQDITSTDPKATVGLHTALMALAQSLTPLYTSNPIVPGGAPLLPSQTQALARLFGSLGGPGTCAGSKAACTWDADCGAGNTCTNPVRDALSGMWARRGYRPFQVGLGAVRPALAYPNLRPLTKSAIALVAPGGSAATQLQQVFTVLQQEMVTAAPTVSVLPDLTIDPATEQPNRPRSAIEFAGALFLSQNDAFVTPGMSSMFIAQRDRRGLVVPSGNTPGVKGTGPAPFVDMNDDGYADVDAFGRFVGAGGTPLALDPPFQIPDDPQLAGTIDAFGRPASSATSFTYLDTAKSLVNGLSAHVSPLVDPTVLTAPGDPNGWQQEHETLMYALSGAYLLYGDRAQTSYDYGTEGPGGQKVAYSGFNAATSPLPDLVHAAGQVIADKDSDAILLSLLDLLKNHESTVARLMGAALKLRDIAASHDAAAAAHTEPLASLAYSVPIWDEMAQVVWAITKKPGLMKALLAALADNTVNNPYGNALNMGDALSKFVTFKDQLTYNKHGTHYDGSAGGINGPAVNLTVDPNGNDQSDPQTPVDNTMPRTGTNMSCLQRSIQLIADANGGPACNKDGAIVASKIGGITLDWPVTGFPLYASPYGECDLFEFNNLGMFYLDSLLPAAHPKRSVLSIKASDLNAIMSFLGVFVSEDTLLQESSDIAGLTQYPEPYALNRLVWFGASTSNPNYQGMPDADAQNQGTQVDSFVSSSIDPLSSAWCPPDATSNMVPTCTDKSGTVRVRDGNSIFLWERFGFTTYLQPIIRALADGGTMGACNAAETSCNLTDFSGEQIFMDLSVILNKHWPGATHGAECQSSSPSMPIYCDGAGVNNYEPILADSFESDIIPALNEFASVATELSKITVQRGPNAGQVWTGADVLEKLTTILFSQDYAKAAGMVDRSGNAGTTWVDGTPQAQVTVFTLFADALHKIDTRFADACQGAANMTTCLADAQTRQGQWKRARSQLVDEFLAVDGTGTSAAFHNPTVTPTLISVLNLARDQVNANCPDRESGTPCTWAKSGLDNKLAGVIGRPLFAAVVDLGDQIRQDETSRRALETFLQYLLQGKGNGGQDLQGTLASLADILQVLLDDGHLSPILNASAVGVSPDAAPGGPGAGSVTLQVLKALTDDTYDRYHVVDQILPNLVNPTVTNGQPNVSPIEILMDVIADVNRIDASDQSAFAPDDYEGVMFTMNHFMIDKTRGLEQLYTIIRNRPNQ